MIDVDKVVEDAKTIYSELIEEAAMPGMAGYDSEARVKAACVQATGRIMEALILSGKNYF